MVWGVRFTCPLPARIEAQRNKIEGLSISGSTKFPIDINELQIHSGNPSGALTFRRRVSKLRLDPMIAGPEGGPSSDMQRYEG